MCGSAHSIAYPVLVSAGCSMSSCAGVRDNLFVVSKDSCDTLIDFATIENDEFMTKVN